jgi:hypothetical protein
MATDNTKKSPEKSQDGHTAYPTKAARQGDPMHKPWQPSRAVRRFQKEFGNFFSRPPRVPSHLADKLMRDGGSAADSGGKTAVLTAFG